MSEIAKCPVCGKNPVVWCKNDEGRIRIMCCRFVAYTTSGWNQYAAAMEFAKAEVWFMETEDFDWSGPLKEDNEDAFAEWDRISFEAAEDLNNAQQRVLEVFNA